MSRYRQQMLVDVMASPSVLSAARQFIEGELERQAAVCSPNKTPADEQRRRNEIGDAERKSAEAENDLIAGVRKAAKELARREIQP